MIFNWVLREGWIVFSWWMLITLAGLAIFPFCTRVLSALPDKGFTLSRIAGLLVIGYIFWILGCLGFLVNTSGSIIFSWVLMLSLSLVIYFHNTTRFDWKTWWKENRLGIIVGEALFIVLLLGWALIRAHLPDLRTTEKPMDLMFISSIMKSRSFPPNDGWMAGYSISYYYFGYFIAAMISTISGVSNTVGYSMNIALVVALTGYAAYGIGYNLIRTRVTAFHHSSVPAVIVGLSVMLMVVFMGNFQLVMIELPFQERIAPENYLKTTGTQDRITYPERQNAEASGVPDTDTVILQPPKSFEEWGSWWWFRSSRVLNDYDLNGQVMPSWYAQPIDEFPQFSFLLGDSHPHVMALPYVLLVIGLALNLFLKETNSNQFEMAFYGLSIGSLIFLNTWDGPIYMFMLVGANGLKRFIERRTSFKWLDLIPTIKFALILVILAVVLYLPFLISFRSQASGLLPNIITPTFFGQFFIMFGPFICILGLYLAIEIWRAGSTLNWRVGFQAAIFIFVLLSIILLVLTLLGVLVMPDAIGLLKQFTEPFGGLGGALLPIMERRLEGLPTTILLLTAITIVAGRLFPKMNLSIYSPSSSNENGAHLLFPKASAFVLLLVGLGCVLILVPEFFYLRDNFSTRINTIFKFYYQGWIIFSIASSYALYSILIDTQLRLPNWIVRFSVGFVALIVFVSGLLYPILGIYDRTMLESGRLANNTPPPLTLDGGPSMVAATDYQSIMCFQKQLNTQNAIVVEALGGAYDPNFGRVAALTGVPSLLGWENHENQWRGSTYPAIVGSRSNDIATLYKDVRWTRALEIIQHYDIDYIFFGTSERRQYGEAGEEKFQDHLDSLCAASDINGQVLSVFYETNHFK